MMRTLTPAEQRAVETLVVAVARLFDLDLGDDRVGDVEHLTLMVDYVTFQQAEARYVGQTGVYPRD